MPSIDDVIDAPEELSDERAEELVEEADLVQDMMGEVCPYPQVEAKKGLQRIDTGPECRRVLGGGAGPKGLTTGQGEHECERKPRGASRHRATQSIPKAVRRFCRAHRQNSHAQHIWSLPQGQPRPDFFR